MLLAMRKNYSKNMIFFFAVAFWFGNWLGSPLEKCAVFGCERDKDSGRGKMECRRGNGKVGGGSVKSAVETSRKPNKSTRTGNHDIHSKNGLTFVFVVWQSKLLNIHHNRWIAFEYVYAKRQTERITGECVVP